MNETNTRSFSTPKNEKDLGYQVTVNGLKLAQDDLKNLFRAYPAEGRTQQQEDILRNKGEQVAAVFNILNNYRQQAGLKALGELMIDLPNSQVELVEPDHKPKVAPDIRGVVETDFDRRHGVTEEQPASVGGRVSD